jgi:hypothetical protein
MTAPFAMPDVAPRQAVRSLVRALTAVALEQYKGIPASKIIQREWNDQPAWYLTRGATMPADMAGTAALVRTLMPEFVEALASQSAAAKIFQDGLQLTFGQDGRISVPTLLGDPSLATFVQEGWPIPVVQGTTQPLTTITPKKLACVIVLTAEMVASSNVEALVEDALFRSTALALDKALLDSNAGDNSRPAGLRAGIAALTSDPSPDSLAALINDISNLYFQVAPVSSGPPMFVTSLARSLTAQLLLPHGWDSIKHVGCVALRGTTDIMAIAPGAVVSVYGGDIEISASRENSLQMESAPTNLTTGPTRSAWQTDCIAIRLKLPVTWALRTAGAVAWLTATHW